jgi:hypothetical protein
MAANGGPCGGICATVFASVVMKRVTNASMAALFA